LAGDVIASVVVRSRGDGILTVLATARWFQKRRDATINMRWKGYRGGGWGSITKGRSGVVVVMGGGSIK
jgi:hypothetical protein